MTLANLINTHASTAAAAGDWATVAETLNALRQVVTDETHWTLGLIQSHPQLGIDVARAIAAAVKTAAQTDPLMEGVMLAMSTTGLQLHTPARQAMIEQIAAGLPQESIEAVKSLGVRYQSLAEKSGLGTVTADQCRDAFREAVLQARIINATALANERLQATQTAEEQAAVWQQAWEDAV